MHKFNYNWKISDGYPAKGIEYHGLKVFSCFACGGGSTMGYKLAGYDVLGCNEIDPKMNECYVANHNPKFNYLEDIREFVKRDDLPQELYELDILDGSPPCSSFSMAGNREKDWGKEKKFKEGQAEQVLDTLFFDFIDLAEKLQPKVVVAENVKGLIQGDAKKYVYKITEAFSKAGFDCHLDLLCGSRMGVPQRRERVFITATRKDISNKINAQKTDMFNNRPYLDLEFNEPVINAKNVVLKGKEKSENTKYHESRFGDVLYNGDKVHSTLVTRNRYFYDLEHYISECSYNRIGAYPSDYNFLKTQRLYLTGMSVPPVMTAQIAHRIKEQWFDKMDEL